MFFVMACKGEGTTGCVLRFSDNSPGSRTHSAEGRAGSEPLLFSVNLSLEILHSQSCESLKAKS